MDQTFRGPSTTTTETKAPAPQPGVIPGGGPTPSLRRNVVAPSTSQEVFGHMADEPDGAQAGKPPDMEAIVGAIGKMRAAERVGRDNPTAILEALRGQDKTTVEFMRAEFEARTGKSLDSWAHEQFQGNPDELDELKAHLAGDVAAGGALAVGDKKRTLGVLSSLTDPAARAEVLARWHEQHPELPIATFIDDNLSGLEAEKAHAYLEGNFAKAKALDLDDERGSRFGDLAARFTGKAGKVADLLRDAGSKEEREQMLVEFAAKRGKENLSPEQALEFFKKDAAGYAKGADLDAIEALAEGNRARAAAATIQIELAKGDGANFDKIAAQMEIPAGLSPEEHEKAVAEHAQLMASIGTEWGAKYGAKDKDGKLVGDASEQLTDAFMKAGAEKPELVRVLAARDKGAMDRKESLQYSMGKKDPALIRASMAGLDEAGLSQLAEQYAMEHPGKTLFGELHDLTGGRDQKDLATTFDHGSAPSTAEGMLDRAEALRDSEHGEGGGLFSGLPRWLSVHSKDSDLLAVRNEELRAKLKAGTLTPEDEDRIRLDLMHQESAVDLYRKDEDTTAKVASTILKLAIAKGLPIVHVPALLAKIAGAAGGHAAQSAITGDSTAADHQQLVSKIVTSVAGEIVHPAITDALPDREITQATINGGLDAGLEQATNLDARPGARGREVVKGTLGGGLGELAGEGGELLGDEASRDLLHGGGSELLKEAGKTAGEKSAEKVMAGESPLAGIKEVPKELLSAHTEGVSETADPLLDAEEERTASLPPIHEPGGPAPTR